MTAPKLRFFEWPTVAMILGSYFFLGVASALYPIAPFISVIAVGIVVAQFGSLHHEALHGHPTNRPWINEALVFPAFFLVIPYRRFQATHLAHHHDPALTDPYDDPESNYCDPAHWARLPRIAQVFLRLNNTLAGRMILGPIIGTYTFLRSEAAGLIAGKRDHWTAWALNALGFIPLLWWLSMVKMPLLAYAGAVYVAMALLRLRTFLEHRAHAQHRARTVIIEDRGPLSLLFLNNNFHVVHHMHPNVAWYDLPALYDARKDHFQRRNDGYVYRNYLQIIRQYLWRAKDPVAHPIWPVQQGVIDDEIAIADPNCQKMERPVAAGLPAGP